MKNQIELNIIWETLRVSNDFMSVKLCRMRNCAKNYCREYCRIWKSTI